MRVCKVASLVLAAVLIPLSGVSSAAFSVYTDFASFDAATDTTLVEDFEGINPSEMDTPLASLTSNGITYTGLQATNPNVWVASAGYTNFGLADPTTSAVLTATGYEFFEIDLSATPYRAIGFDVYLNDDGPVTTRYYDAADDLIWTIGDFRGAGAVRFVGVLNDDPIHRIEWESTALPGQAQQINTGLDNLLLGTEWKIPLVPAPGAVVLGAFGTGLVGWLRRRRAL